MTRFTKKSVKSRVTDIPSEGLTIRLDSLKNKKKDKQDTHKVACAIYAGTMSAHGIHSINKLVNK